MCLAANVSKGLAGILQTCSTTGASILGYDGSSGLMLLSKNRFLSKSFKPLDSFLLRRAILHAQIQVLGGPVHLFCTHLSTPVSEVDYTGSSESWKAEQAYQVEQIVSYVKQTATRFPAVLMGDLNCGPANAEWEVMAEFPDNFNKLLEAGFQCPYCEDHGHCTFCGQPELGGKSGPGKIIDHLLFMNFGDGLLHPERTLESTVIVKTSSGHVKVPISDHYGVRCNLDVPFVSGKADRE
jgi:endonuclease/exonuclease/phosphatase family metal-dependent hydrolase